LPENCAKEYLSQEKEIAPEGEACLKQNFDKRTRADV
jgi:hypothetical protein